MNDEMSESEEAGDLLLNNTPEEVAEIVEIASGHGLDLEEAVEVKELAEELGIDTDDALEIRDAL